MALIIGLIILGILLLVLEIMILPGLIAGIIGAVFLIIAISWMYAEYGSTAGNITLGGTLVLTFGAIIYAFKARSWNRFSLKGTIDGRVNVIDPGLVNAGDTGKAVSAMRPGGTVMVNEKRFEARTNGEIISAGTPVKVLKVEGSKLLVETINN